MSENHAAMLRDLKEMIDSGQDAYSMLAFGEYTQVSKGLDGVSYELSGPSCSGEVYENWENLLEAVEYSKRFWLCEDDAIGFSSEDLMKLPITDRLREGLEEWYILIPHCDECACSTCREFEEFEERLEREYGPMPA